jgi:hypothetical protein
VFRKIGAILAGLAAFAALEIFAGQLARSVWPAYAVAFPTRAYTLDMLLARQAVGMLCTLAAGAAAAWVGRGAKQTVVITGMLMLLIAVIWHVRIWEQYPVWYHLLLFAYLVPLTLLGGRLPKAAMKQE